MLYVKAFHIIAMVAWFAGLFYLPRLFVYHADTQDEISIHRFKIMEKRLYYGITWPAAVLTTLLGLWLLSYNSDYYLKAGWMHAKLSLVVLLWIYHLFCGHYLKLFAQNKNQKKSRFFRIYNETPTLFLIAIVILVVVKP
ncbi:protoporphyrinogen oxidase HemJ [Fluoribacter dumoffii]|uniref:Protoporphyrinogen IX oxidase n=1 Tax=Fluoribacter dumoffii TaxID=463 RepID=A0A377G9A3_9GAMM|nr:protoporphyrinogen oxidase HemJ [Fluoribacter dumoffii]KTC90252.1 transmembrane protein [Fluoribacter dumoffii NY 23]MCW8418597.1 protoporphyrinogen oxidase HemJ [Fluoribacter dumoffii]MCW8453559.1 protoporphyrinogen oxidase HemJ [Fluoribacter dumoffii]MCW8459222.1 protoporphyrinogen oxidase HemJ [Fluoribacter dumoffii]MCW8482581.1 protoporphyrinogen oxidase HemJ [Fluoribacter dumoffii]